MKNIIIGTVILIQITSTAIANDGDYDDLIRHYPARAGHKMQIEYARSWDPACRSTEAAVTITQPPAHGVVTKDKVRSVIPDKGGECAGRPAVEVRIFYTPLNAYQGPDRIILHEEFGNGGSRNVDVSVDVMPRSTQVRAGQVFRTVPQPGSLDAPPGMTLYVNDGSCPAGQIKRMVTGSMNPPVPRTFDCVQR